MRNIKFRGRDFKDKWHYGALVASEHYAEIITFVHTSKSECVHVDMDTVGQFTGLKDRNGVEIYEGDIVSNGSTQTMTVMYDKSRAGFMGVTDYATAFQTTRVWLLTMPEKQLEVIGNIHDNPRK